jgi:hypothetical protein
MKFLKNFRKDSKWPLAKKLIGVIIMNVGIRSTYFKPLAFFKEDSASFAAQNRLSSQHY